MRTVLLDGAHGAPYILAYLLGGGVDGGRVVSDWPGLDIPNLFNGEDLKITTDLRSVLSEILTKHLGANASDLNTVFPGFNGPNTANVFLSNKRITATQPGQVSSLS